MILNKENSETIFAREIEVDDIIRFEELSEEGWPIAAVEKFEGYVCVIIRVTYKETHVAISVTMPNHREVYRLWK